jgi:hypothetical protein
MNTSDLDNALNGYSSGKELTAKISKEVGQYKSLMKKPGQAFRCVLLKTRILY